MNTEQNNSQALNKGIPTPVKVLVGAAIVAAIGYGVFRFASEPATPEAPAPGPVAGAPAAFAERLATIWPDIFIRIDSVARQDDLVVIAHWTYRNEGLPSAEPFKWTDDQPDAIALTRFRDAAGKEYPVALSLGTGTPLCASIRENGQSAQIPGGGSFPAWAAFTIPATAQLPLSIILHGAVGPKADGVAVPLLSVNEQAALAMVARETSWPDIWIQLDEVARTAEGTYRVRWRYLNRNLEKPFTWSRDQPDLPVRTQLFDFASGAYRVPSSASSIHGKGSTTPTTIPPGGELPAEAIYNDVKGNHFELIFHGALPVFIGNQGTN